MVEAFEFALSSCPFASEASYVMMGMFSYVICSYVGSCAFVGSLFDPSDMASSA